MNSRERKERAITIILSFLIALGASLIIIFRNSPFGKTILDSLAIIAGLFQTIVSIFIFREVEKSYIKMLAFLLMIIGIATVLIHLMRIAPVEIWKILGIR
jgi:hypothetical protein